MAVFRNLFKDIDGIFETKFENVTIVEGTDYESGYKSGYEDGERVGREQGYSQGLIDGENEAKNKLSLLSVSENGTYIPQNGEIGFKEVKVSVKTQPSQGSYEDGYNDGYQKGLSEGYENGYNEGSSEGYNVGYTNGRSDALAQLKELVVKENGEYLPQEGIGFNKVMVSVEGSDCDCFTVTLSEDGIIELKNAQRVIEENQLLSWETGYELYEVDEYGYFWNVVSMESAVMDFSWDVSAAMQSERRYVAIGKIYDGGTVVFSARSEIVSMPIKAILSENGIVTAGKGGEYILDLYNAENDVLIQSVGAVDIPFNVSYLMEEGKSYYVVLTRDGSSYKSNTIVCSYKTWFLSDIEPLYYGYLTIENNLIVANGEPWYVVGENGEEIGIFDMNQPFDLSPLDKSKNYSIYNGINEIFAAKLQYGTPPEPVWLFKDEWVDEGGRYDLPAPIAGEWYVCYVDGNRIGAAMCYDYEGEISLDLVTSDWSTCWFMYIKYRDGDIGYWQFHPAESNITSGQVSVEILNVSEV